MLSSQKRKTIGLLFFHQKLMPIHSCDPIAFTELAAYKFTKVLLCRYYSYVVIRNMYQPISLI
jgi:hypothetical protein